MTPTGKKLSGWWLEKVRSSAQPHLEAGESVRAAAYGQETKYQFSSFLCFWRPRLFAATERNMYIFSGGSLNSAKAGKVLAKAPLAHAGLVRDGRALRAGEVVIWPPPGAGTETNQLLDYYASKVGSGAGPEADTTTEPTTPAREKSDAGASPTTPAQPSQPPRESIPPPTGHRPS